MGSAEGHEYPVLYRLSDNLISGQIDDKKRVLKTSKLRESPDRY
jgi:hypothetical protein